MCLSQLIVICPLFASRAAIWRPVADNQSYWFIQYDYMLFAIKVTVFVTRWPFPIVIKYIWLYGEMVFGESFSIQIWAGLFRSRLLSRMFNLRMPFSVLCPFRTTAWLPMPLAPSIRTGHWREHYCTLTLVSFLTIDSRSFCAFQVYLGKGAI